MKLILCSHFSSVGSLIKEEIENKKVAFTSDNPGLPPPVCCNAPDDMSV